MTTETLRELCLALPGITEEIKWEHDLVFSIGGKMVCVTSFKEPFKASFKVRDEAYEEWCAREDVVPAPYLARAKWVMVGNEARLSKEEWHAAITTSYSLVAAKLTKKQRSGLGNVCAVFRLKNIPVKGTGKSRVKKA